MKTSWGVLLLFSIVSGGCLTLPAPWTAPKTPPVAATPTAAAPSRPQLAREQVTEENARESADALLEELDEEVQQAPAAGAKKP